MTPEELVQQVQQALPDRLSAAVLYGSAAAGDFVEGTSNYNVFLVLDQLGMAELDALSPIAKRWVACGNRAPLLFNQGQVAESADVFPIELLDMRDAHRVLFGDDPLKGVAVRPENLRMQIERELRGHLLGLRERYLATGGKPKQVAELMTSSVAAFLVLFRAVLRLYQDDVPRQKLDALRLLTQHIPFDPTPFEEVDALKYGRRKLRDVAPLLLFESYLTTIERVVEAVDRRLHPKTGDSET